MKFKLTEEQAEALQNISLQRNSMLETLNFILARNESMMSELSIESDLLWGEIMEEHQLSEKVSWEIKQIDGITYVVDTVRTSGDE